MKLGELYKYLICGSHYQDGVPLLIYNTSSVHFSSLRLLCNIFLHITIQPWSQHLNDKMNYNNCN